MFAARGVVCGTGGIAIELPYECVAAKVLFQYLQVEVAGPIGFVVRDYGVEPTACGGGVA